MAKKVTAVVELMLPAQQATPHLQLVQPSVSTV